VLKGFELDVRRECLESWLQTDVRLEPANPESGRGGGDRKRCQPRASSGEPVQQTRGKGVARAYGVDALDDRGGYVERPSEPKYIAPPDPWVTATCSTPHSRTHSADAMRPARADTSRISSALTFMAQGRESNALPMPRQMSRE
jgi:hypothetical protein